MFPLGLLFVLFVPNTFHMYPTFVPDAIRMDSNEFHIRLRRLSAVSIKGNVEQMVLHNDEHLKTSFELNLSACRMYDRPYTCGIHI